MNPAHPTSHPAFENAAQQEGPAGRPGRSRPAHEWLILLFACVWPTLYTWVYFTGLAGHESAKAAYAIGKAIQFALPLVWLGLVLKEPMERMRPRKSGLAWGMAFGCGVLLATVLLFHLFLEDWPLLRQATDLIGAKLRGFSLHTPARFVAMAAFYCVIHSLLEEYYWRWFVFRRMTAWLPLGVAVLVSSVAFSAHHLLVLAVYLQGYGWPAWFFAACVGIGGAAWAVIYYRTQNLTAAWVSHAIIDVAVMYVGYRLTFG